MAKEELIIELGKKVELNDLSQGDYFYVELRPQLTSNAKHDYFIGRLEKITEYQFAYKYIYATKINTSPSLIGNAPVKIRVSQFERALEFKNFRSAIDRIMDIYKVDIK